jgi:hypothetical protein
MTRNDTWKKVMDMKRKETRVVKGCCNSLTADEVKTICATMDFFGATDRLIQDTFYMLQGFGKFRVFDWLATELDTLNRGKEEESNIQALKVITYSYLKAEGDIDEFIQDLRETDYQVSTAWEEVEL